MSQDYVNGHHLANSTSRGATPETVKKAFEIIVSDPKVKSIFINIFGGENLELGFSTIP